jgi:hypothetical protein
MCILNSHEFNPKYVYGLLLHHKSLFLTSSAENEQSFAFNAYRMQLVSVISLREARATHVAEKEKSP